MPHSEISVTGRLGAWWQKILTTEVLKAAVCDKEKLHSKYKENINIKQWLLLVIGEIGASSYVVDPNVQYSIDTFFDKIYILEDHYNNLYELK